MQVERQLTTIPQDCSDDLLVDEKKRLCKVCHEGDTLPPKKQVYEEGPLRPLGSKQTTVEGGGMARELDLMAEVPQQSLWSDPSFNVIKFTMRYLPFP